MLFNQSRAKRIMAAESIDALVATSPDNVTYASGYWAMSHWARPGGPQAYAVIPADGGASPCLIAGSGNLDHVVDGESCMVLCVETPYYELGFAGLQLENTVVVRAHGAEPLTSLGNELRIV